MLRQPIEAKSSILPLILAAISPATWYSAMAYIITSETVGLAIGLLSETANDVHEALRKARRMYEIGVANVSIEDEAGHSVGGDELVACITGRKSITDDLRIN